MKPNKQYDHVFVILRLDDFQGSAVPVQERISVTKIFWDGEAAAREVARLNELQGNRGVRYFSQVGRLERKEIASVSVNAPTLPLTASLTILPPVVRLVPSEAPQSAELTLVNTPGRPAAAVARMPQGEAYALAAVAGD